MPRDVLLALGFLAAPRLAQEAVTFETADGVTVHADLYPHEGDPSRGAILLFHQAGGNAGEYREIAPRLAAQGFAALAVDQRMGGSMHGHPNRTMAGLTGPVMSFDAVLPDLAAALAYARETWPDSPLLLWGSSYSADLVVALAAMQGTTEPNQVAEEEAGDPTGDLAGVLAFSPPGLLRETDPLDLAAQVRVPVFITYASADGERAVAAELAEALPSGLATLDEPEIATHGSMMLLDTVNPAGAEEQWNVVETFLDRVAP
jgi:dienelactone hydrolase